jgi:hypothetical protein
LFLLAGTAPIFRRNTNFISSIYPGINSFNTYTVLVKKLFSDAPKFNSFQDVANLPPPTCSLIKFRIMKGPKQVRRKVAQDIALIEHATRIPLRGYVQRTVSEYVEVVLVTTPTTEGAMATVLSQLIRKWAVDTASLTFQAKDSLYAHFLKFQVVQANGEPEGFSAFFEENDAFSVVSSIR